MDQRWFADGSPGALPRCGPGRDGAAGGAARGALAEGAGHDVAAGVAVGAGLGYPGRPMGEYTGGEQATSWSGKDPDSGTAYVVRPPGLPAGAVPMYDDDTQAVVGFRVGSGGVYRIYDLQGEMVGMYEEPLQTPLFDPLDFIFIFGGVFRALGKATFGAATRTAVVGGMRGVVATMGEATAAMLRASMRRLLAGELKFTTTTAARMATKGRHVPLQILKLAIRYGKRAPDPQGVAGAFEYTIPMARNGVDYTLKVVLREADNTILHFHYFK